MIATAFVNCAPLSAQRGASEALLSPRQRLTDARLHSRSAAPLRRARRVPTCQQPGADEEQTTTSTPTSTSTSETTTTTSGTGAGNEEKKKPPFEIRGFSLANVFLSAGTLITVFSFVSYIASSGTASATSLGFVYGVPILLVGCALKYAELQPVRVDAHPDAPALRNAVATDTQKQIYSDITRHRYGDEAHLSAAMAALGLQPRGEACPVLEWASERPSVDGKGAYELELVFYSVATPYSEWEKALPRYQTFFGPGVDVSVRKFDASKRQVALTIRSQQTQSL